MWKAEIGLFNGLPLNEWLWLSAVLIITLLSIYVVGQFVKIVRRKI